MYNWKEIDKEVIPNITSMSAMEIAKKYNKDYRCVRYHYGKLGLLKSMSKPIRSTKDNWEEIDKEVIPNINNISVMEIAKKYNIGYKRVIYHYTKLGLLNLMPKQIRFTKDNWKEIDKEVIPNINNMSVMVIAKKYDIEYHRVRYHYGKLDLLKYMPQTKRSTKRNWNVIDKDIMDNPSYKYSYKELSKKYNTPIVTLRLHFKKEELKSLKDKIRSEYYIDWDTIEKDIFDNPFKYTIDDIIKKYGISKTTIGQYSKFNLFKFKRKMRVVDWSTIDSEVLPIINTITLSYVCNKYKLDYDSVYHHYKRAKKLSKFKKWSWSKDYVNKKPKKVKLSKRKEKWKMIDEKVIPVIDKVTVSKVAKYFNITRQSIVKHYKDLGLYDKFDTYNPFEE